MRTVLVFTVFLLTSIAAQAQEICVDPNGDAAKVACDANLYLYTQAAPAAATGLLKLEDAAHATGHAGVLLFTVRQDVLGTSGVLAGTAADYQAFTSDAQGKTHVSSTARGDVVADADDNAAVKFAVINVDGADSDSVVAAVASKKIKVLGYTVICDGAGTITFEDEDGTDVTGAMALAANGGVSAAVSAIGQFETPVANKALHLLKSAAVNCDGHLTYIEVD